MRFESHKALTFKKKILDPLLKLWVTVKVKIFDSIKLKEILSKYEKIVLEFY
jgi:hypothetical protein